VLDSDKSESQSIGDSGRAQFKWDDDKQTVSVAYTAGTGVLRYVTSHVTTSGVVRCYLHMFLLASYLYGIAGILRYGLVSITSIMIVRLTSLAS